MGTARTALSEGTTRLLWTTRCRCTGVERNYPSDLYALATLTDFAVNGCAFWSIL